MARGTIKDGEGYTLAQQLSAREDIGAIYSMAIDMRNRMAIMSFRVGNGVEWDGKRGNHMSGKVIKVNQTTAKVLADAPDGRIWNVSLSLLRLA